MKMEIKNVLEASEILKQIHLILQDLKSGSGEKSESSVFNNPFRAKEIREKAILERHVEMTSRQVKNILELHV
jgi:hypothetical protein